MNSKGFTQLALVFIFLAFLILTFAQLAKVSLKFYKEAENPTFSQLLDENLNTVYPTMPIETAATGQIRNINREEFKPENFCPEYITKQVELDALFDSYEVSAGDTIRSIALSETGLDTDSIRLYYSNPVLNSYEVDETLDELVGSVVYLPKDPYSINGVTRYGQVSGNISYRNGSEYFVINTPLETVGPFTLPSEQYEIARFNDGDCVTALYGHKPSKSTFYIFDLVAQTQESSASTQ